MKVFRVDNPHTKALRFWEWCIGEIKARHPEVIFLAGAFTRPKLMYALAKGGFSQSYTYFTWRHTKQEFQDYVTELTRPPVSRALSPERGPVAPCVIESAHPSPLSMKKFIGSKPFSKINAALVAKGRTPIDWSLRRDP